MMVLLLVVLVEAADVGPEIIIDPSIINPKNRNSLLNLLCFINYFTPILG
jgi:hypothetical protein